MSKQLLLSCFALCSLFANHLTLACSPAPDASPAPLAERVDAAPFVFEGVVLAMEEHTAIVDVKHYFKGEGGDIVQVSGFNTHSCSNFLEPEQHLIFFAEGSAESGLFAIYDGAFGSVRSANDATLQAITDSIEQNSQLEGKNCAAVFDGARLSIPCVKVAHSDEIYQVELRRVYSLPNQAMQFSLSNFRKHSKSDDNNGILPFYAQVNDIHVNIMESMPVQVSVTVEGVLRNSCESLSPTTQELVQPDRQGNFKLAVTLDPPTDEQCLQVITPYSITIPLDVYGLDAGIYTVIVNKENNVTFELTQDNRLPAEEPPIIVPAPEPLPLPAMELKAYEAALESAKVVIIPSRMSDAVEVELLVYGYLRDGCENLSKEPTEAIGADANGVFNVPITVLAPDKASAICTAVVTPFEKRVSLGTQRLGAGEYKININNGALEVSFEL